jgi:hypothetical protein
MPRRKLTRRRRTRKAGLRLGQPEDQPAEQLYPGSGTQLDGRLDVRTRRGKRTLKKGGKLHRKL